MEKLSGDVLSNIFIRLFAKQLAQMRCVSKSWNALLSRSSFINSHLHRSTHNNNDKILMLFRKACDFGSEPITTHPSPSPHVELTNFIKLPVNLNFEGASVIGSVNGLLCLNCRSYSGSGLHIWNPSLSAVLAIPPYSMSSHGYDQKETLFRFGFDPKTDDYKIVKLEALLETERIDLILVAFLGISLISVKEWLQVEVYSMRKGSWKVTTQRFPSQITGISITDDVCVDGHDGHLHWLCCIDEIGKQQIIVAFNLDDESFSEISLPDFTLDSSSTLSYRHNVLGVLGGKLCVMSRGGGVLECEVWEMDEYGNGMAESWVKHHAFSQFSSDIFPYGFTLHNEFLFVAYNGRLALYDPIEAMVKIFKTIDRACCVVKVVNYVDSLVWVAPSECDISSCNISRLPI
ncbi:hypothetical protein Lser_V15G36585 [Lactuca serriola]